MATILNADTVTGGAVVTGDSTGILQLQGGGTPRLTFNTSGAIGVGSSPDYGTSGYVLTSAGSGSAPVWTQFGAALATPTLSGVTSANMATTISITISNYNALYAYNVAVTGGSYTRTGNTISWTLPSVGSNTVNYLYVQASYSGSSSSIGIQSVNVLTTLVTDTPFSVTNFAVNSLNNGWTI